MKGDPYAWLVTAREMLAQSQDPDSPETKELADVVQKLEHALAERDRLVLEILTKGRERGETPS